MDFLLFARRFTNLSVYNVMLVNIQRPGALAAGSEREWDEVGRAVNADAVPIVILQPFGPVRFIFEVGDTSGPPLPGEDYNPLHAKGVMNLTTYRRTIDAAYEYGIAVDEVDNYGSGRAGTATSLVPRKMVNKKLEGPSWRIKLNSRDDLPSRFSTLTHELGHIYCGHLGGDHRGRWPDRRGLGHAQVEVEAEATAWIVCQRAGIETMSEDYILEHAKGCDLSSVSVYAIFEAANRIESRTTPQKK